MLLVVGAIVVALVVVPPPWGLVLVVAAAGWQLAETAFWFRHTKRFPIAVGHEAMIGLPVTVIAPCRPDGRVRFHNERWRAHCAEGADVGDGLVIEAVEEMTLVVGRPV